LAAGFSIGVADGSYRSLRIEIAIPLLGGFLAKVWGQVLLSVDLHFGFWGYH